MSSFCSNYGFIGIKQHKRYKNVKELVKEIGKRSYILRTLKEIENTFNNPVISYNLNPISKKNDEKNRTDDPIGESNTMKKYKDHNIEIRMVIKRFLLNCYAVYHRSNPDVYVMKFMNLIDDSVISPPSIYLWYAERLTICYDSYWECFCLFRTRKRNIFSYSIEPSRALCNKAKCESFTDKDLDKLESYKFEIERVEAMKELDKEMYLLVRYKPIWTYFSNDKKSTSIKYFWNSEWIQRENSML